MKNTIIIILSAISVALASYLYYDSNDVQLSKAQIQSQFTDLKSEYESMQNDFEGKMDILGTNQEIIKIQKRKIDLLFKKAEITEAELNEAKKILKSISQSVYNGFEQKISSLEVEKNKVQTELEQGENKLKILNKKLDVLEIEKKELAKKFSIEKRENQKKEVLLNYAARLTLTNFNLKSFKVRNNGTEVETDKASRIDRIKLIFDVNENKITKSEQKQIYICVIAPDGNPAQFKNAKIGSFMLGKQKIEYTDSLSFMYENTTTQSLNFSWDGDDFAKGDYSFEIYEKNGKEYSKIGKIIKSLN